MDIAQTITPAFNWRRIVGAVVYFVLGYHLLLILRYTECYDMRAEHDRWYGEPTAGDRVELYILAVVGSSSASTPAFDTGNWPAGVDKNIFNNGRIAGRGGNGGAGGSTSTGFPNPGSPGGAGGLALRVTAPIDFHNGGVVAGGGGGGGGGGASNNNNVQFFGGGGGGGGAGRNGGNGGGAGSPGGGSGNGGALTTGGTGGLGRDIGGQHAGAGGTGGTPGQPGAAGQKGDFIGSLFDGAAGGSAGAAGPAIEGIGDITFIDANGVPTAEQGTILGATS